MFSPIQVVCLTAQTSDDDDDVVVRKAACVTSNVNQFWRWHTGTTDGGYSMLKNLGTGGHGCSWSNATLLQYLRNYQLISLFFVFVEACVWHLSLQIRGLLSHCKLVTRQRTFSNGHVTTISTQEDLA